MSLNYPDTSDDYHLASRSRKPQIPFYDFLTPKQQRDIFMLVQGVSEYLLLESIHNLILVDGSARPLYIGVKQYMSQKYPGRKCPNIYFMNPQGFLYEEDNGGAGNRWTKLLQEEVRTKEAVMEDFGNTYRRLIKDKDRSTLLFDTCIHTGQSLQLVSKILEEFKFSQVRIGAATPAESVSTVQADFYVSENGLQDRCHPFGRSSGVAKTYRSVTSVPAYEERWLSTLNRENIKAIVAKTLSKGVK